MVDCGDFGNTTVKSQILKVDYLLKGMSLLHYDAINLAEKDLQYGLSFLEEKQREYDLPFISANVYRQGTEELFARPYIIKKIKNLKIGIFGVTSLSAARLLKPSAGFEIQDPIEAARNVVAGLSTECDVVVALAHLGLEGAKDLAQQVPGIDIMVSGHDKKVEYHPIHIGKTTLIQTGYQGKYLGHMEFNFSGGSLSLLNGKVVSLNAKIQDDAELAGLIAEFDKAFVSLYPMDSATATDNYSPSSERACARCHRQEHRQWSSTGHATAWKSLVNKQSNLNSDCQQCHTSRFEQPDGFTTVFETPYFVNVQCVDCHKLAAGKDIRTHADNRRRRQSLSLGVTNGSTDFESVTESTCLRCHDSANSPKFDYQEYLTKISH